MANNNNNNADKWRSEQSGGPGNPWDSIQLQHVPRFFPDSVYAQASTVESPPLPTLDSFSVQHISPVATGMFEVNGQYGQHLETNTTSYQDSQLPQISQRSAMNTSNYHESQSPPVTQPPVGIIQRLYPNNLELWPPPSPWANYVHPFVQKPSSNYNPPHDYSKPSTLFDERVSTPPPPPASEINPCELLDVLKIAGLQCSPSDKGFDGPIPHTNRILHGNPRFCLRPLDFAERREVGLLQILDFGSRILVARRRIKALFVDKTIRIPRDIEEFIQDLGESAGQGRNDVPLKEAVEDLENFLKTVLPTKRPKTHSSDQILNAVHQLFTHAMEAADRAYETARHYRSGREEIDRTYLIFTDYQNIVEYIKAIQAKVIKMYETENEGTFLFTDFETVECLLSDLDRMKLLARRKKWNYPRAEQLGNNEMEKLLERFKVLGREVVKIYRERGVSEEDSEQYYLDCWLSRST